MALIKLTYFKPSGKYAYDGQMNYSDTLHMFHLSDHIQDLNRTHALPGLGSGVWEGTIHVDAGEHPHGYPMLVAVTYPHGGCDMKPSPPNPPMMRIGECGDRFDNQSGQRIKHADLAKHAVAITHHDRYMWCRAPENATKLWNIINDGECGSNMDASIDKYIRGDR